MIFFEFVYVDRLKQNKNITLKNYIIKLQFSNNWIWLQGKMLTGTLNMTNSYLRSFSLSDSHYSQFFSGSWGKQAKQQQGLDDLDSILGSEQVRITK